MDETLELKKLSVEKAVHERYALGAQERVAALCCPVDYDKKYLEIIPSEIIDRDYGCGDPSKYVREGETVLDLGSGGGKICFIAAQVVGPTGKIIGVDMNEEMLSLANKYRTSIGDQLGYHNVEFRKGKIQDLKLDWNTVDQYLHRNPLHSASDFKTFEEYLDELRSNHPMIPSDSIDVVVSNCVLNLVKEEDKKQLFHEMFRVLRSGGRVAISDIVSDETIPEHQKNDAHLWSGCISGAFREDDFLKAFEEAGFYGITIVRRDATPWQVVEGIEYRSITVLAYKGKQGACFERNQAVIYKGPWKAVIDDDGHTLFRGERMAVCDKTYKIYTRSSGPYSEGIIGIEPHAEVPLIEAGSFNCTKNARRNPRETKGLDYNETLLSDGDCCGPDGCC